MAKLDYVAEKSAQGSLYLFTGRLISEILNTISIIIVARFLTPEEMGIYGLSFVFPGLFTIFSTLGLGQALTRFLAKLKNAERWTDVKQITLIGFLFQVGLSCFLAAIMYTSAVPLATVALRRPDLVDIVRITSILVISQSVFNMATATFFGLERMDLRALAEIIFSLVRGIISPVLVIQGYGVKGAIYGLIGGTSLAALFSVVFIVIYLRGKKGKPSRNNEDFLSDMLRFGFPLYLSTLVVQIDLSYRGLLLAWFTNNIAIGNLDVANKFLSMVNLFTLPITSTVYPTFSKFNFTSQTEELKVLYRSSVRYATLLLIPTTIIIIVQAGEGIKFLFGASYELAPGFLSLSLLQFFAVGLGSLSVFGFLNSQGDTATSFRLNAIKVGLNMFLGTFLTWMWGVSGLLVAMFISSIAGNLLNQHIIKKKYGIIHDFIHMIRVTIFSIIAGLTTWQTLLNIGGSNTFMNIALSSLFFFVLCLILAPLSHALEISDLITLRRVLKKARFINIVILPFLTLEERIIQLISHTN